MRQFRKLGRKIGTHKNHLKHAIHIEYKEICEKYNLRESLPCWPRGMIGQHVGAGGWNDMPHGLDCQGPSIVPGNASDLSETVLQENCTSIVMGNESSRRK